MTENEAKVYMSIKNATYEKPKSRKDVTKETGLKKRIIEKAIVNLRNKYGVPVFGLKHEGHHGYFIAYTEEERIAGTVVYEKQISTSVKNLQIMKTLNLEKYKEDVSNGTVAV